MSAENRFLAVVPGRGRRDERNSEPREWVAWLPAGGLGLLLAVLVLPPIFILIQISLTKINLGQPDSFTLDNFKRLFADPKLYASAWNSVQFSAGATVVTLLLGGALAWVVERTDAPLRRLAYVTTVVSLGTPYILYVAAWLFLLGHVGPFNQAYRTFTGSDDDLINVYSLGGMIFIEGCLWSPLAFLLLASTFKRANAEVEEAARMSGATALQTLWRVSIRLALPVIAGLAIFVFIRSIEAFDVPVLIGMPHKINLLTTDIYVGMTQNPPQVGYASAFAVVMIVFVAVLLYFYGKVSKHADRYASVTGKGFRPRQLSLGRWGWLGSLLVIVHFIIVLLLPMAGLLWISLMPFMQAMSFGALHSVSGMHYIAVLEDSSYLEIVTNSLVAAAVAATVVVALSAVAGWLAVRRRPGSGILEQLTGVPLVFPGVILAIAMMQIALRVPFALYGTLALIVIAFVIRYLPYGMRYAYSGTLLIHRELEEAASAAGASSAVIFMRVIIPLLSPALITAWIFIFLVGAKELSMVVLLAGTHSRTMAVAIFDQWTNGQQGDVAAMGILWTLFLSFCSVFMHFVARRRARRLGRALE